MSEKVHKTDEQWRAELTPEQYEVLRRKGTERPFTGPLNENKASGEYRCAGKDMVGFCPLVFRMAHAVATGNEQHGGRA